MLVYTKNMYIKYVLVICTYSRMKKKVLHLLASRPATFADRVAVVRAVRTQTPQSR